MRYEEYEYVFPVENAGGGRDRHTTTLANQGTTVITGPAATAVTTGIAATTTTGTTDAT